MSAELSAEHFFFLLTHIFTQFYWLVKIRKMGFRLSTILSQSHFNFSTCKFSSYTIVHVLFASMHHRENYNGNIIKRKFLTLLALKSFM